MASDDQHRQHETPQLQQLDFVQLHLCTIPPQHRQPNNNTALALAHKRFRQQRTAHGRWEELRMGPMLRIFAIYECEEQQKP